MYRGRLFALGLAAAALAFAQSGPEILQKTAATYKNLTSCHFESVTISTTRLGGAVTKSQLEMVVAFVKPNKARVEYKYPTGGGWVRVTDGQSTAQYRAWTKLFRKTAASPADIDMINGTSIFQYQLLAARAPEAKLVKQEPLAIGATHTDCWVVEVTGESGEPVTYWIDKARYVVLQEKDGSDDAEVSKLTTYTVADINQTVPDTLFAVAPPTAKAALE